MSSDKRRLKLRLKRLQETFQSLGKDPNAKEYEVKSLTLDFDRVARKQIARLKKAKQQRLMTRQEILNVYGLKSRERITIDEEITSMMKNFEADQKRLKAIMLNFEEKKPDMQEIEKKERLDLIQLIKDCFNIFKLTYNDQTQRAEKGAGMYYQVNPNSEFSVLQNDMSQSELSSKRIAQQPLRESNETQMGFLDETLPMQQKSARMQGAANLSLDFDNVVVKIVNHDSFDRIIDEEVRGYRKEMGPGRI